jgi:hypothetical protein
VEEPTILIWSRPVVAAVVSLATGASVVALSPFPQAANPKATAPPKSKFFIIFIFLL